RRDACDRHPGGVAQAGGAASGRRADSRAAARAGGHARRGGASSVRRRGRIRQDLLSVAGMPFVDATAFHVAVIGGGPAGLASAIALARENLSSIVVERTGYDEPRVGEHLPPSAKAKLVALGLRPNDHASCPGVRSIWGTQEAEDKDYLFSPDGEGVSLSRPQFDRMLASSATAAGAVVARS